MNPSSRLLLALAIGLLASCSSHSRLTPDGALQQVGFVWLKRPGNEMDRRKIINAVHEFARDIPEVTQASVGVSDGIGNALSDTSYDVGFVLSFANEAARQRYNTHPVHEKAAREVFLPLSRKLLFYRFVSE